jgi:hypothetical protein
MQSPTGEDRLQTEPIPELVVAEMVHVHEPIDFRRKIGQISPHFATPLLVDLFLVNSDFAMGQVWINKVHWLDVVDLGCTLRAPRPTSTVRPPLMFAVRTTSPKLFGALGNIPAVTSDKPILIDPLTAPRRISCPVSSPPCCITQGPNQSTLTGVIIPNQQRHLCELSWAPECSSSL